MSESSDSGPAPSGPEREQPEAPRKPAGLRLASEEEVELVVEKLVAGGEGLGRFEGIPIFVPRSAPGDRLRVRLTERRPDYGRGEILEILEPGPKRREPPCPYFIECGGCDLQHLEDAYQTRLKVDALKETLGRLGRIERMPKIRVRAAAPWAYRMRNQLQVEVRKGTAEPTAGREGGREAGREDGEVAAGVPSGVHVVVGYHARKSNRLVPVERCPILVPELEELLPKLPGILGAKAPRRLDLAAGGEGQITSAPVVEGLPHGEVTVQVGEFRLAFDARCFFQSHRALLPALVEEAVGDWTGEEAFELYSGVGLFSLPLARRYAKVRAVEGDRVAVRHARNNARRNRVTNLTVDSQSAESWLNVIPEGAERVLLDPPRAGLSPKVRRGLIDRRPRRLTYVSCHAATLARDLRSLCRFFDLESLTALDLFPQTGHLEAVAQLKLKEKAPG